MNRVVKTLIVLLVIVSAALLLGWFTVSRDGAGDPHIRVNTETIQEDAETAVEATKEGARQVVEGGEKLVEEARKTEVDVDIRRKDEPGKE